MRTDDELGDSTKRTHRASARSWRAASPLFALAPEAVLGICKTPVGSPARWERRAISTSSGTLEEDIEGPIEDHDVPTEVE